MSKPTTVVPSPEEVQGLLGGLSQRGRAALAELSGVPAHTLKKLRLGIHAPLLGTVHKFWPHLRQAKKL